MSEQVSNQGGYPGKIIIMIDGQEREVYDTNSMFGYITALMRVRENERAGKVSAGLLEDVMQTSDLRPYFETLLDGDGELNRSVVEQAEISNRFHAVMRLPDRTSEDEAAYGDWVRTIRDTDEFRLMLSDAFEAMAPLLETDGREPYELTA